MFSHFNPAELEVLLRERLAAYREEAQWARALPKHPLRRRVARLLRGWAEALEPTASPRPLREF